jgi:hypothetical protein
MTADLTAALLANLLSPAVLFFVLGVIATVGRSDLKFPEPLYTSLTIYLLVAIGFKGGVALAQAGLSVVAVPALAAVALGALIPLWAYPSLRVLGGFSSADAAGIAAHYGSVSAVTFIAATNFLRLAEVSYEGFAPALLAVMEAPAIVVAITLGKLNAGNSGGEPWTKTLRRTIHESVFGRSVLLLLGSMAIGWASGPRGAESTAAFFVAPFQGILSLFLLEMGMVAARRLADLRKAGSFLIAWGIVAPLLHASLGVLAGRAVGLSMGGAVLLGTLAASASYIAAPAAVRLALPEANPTYSLTAAIGITFPFNLAIGMPLYLEFAKRVYGSP